MKVLEKKYSIPSNLSPKITVDNALPDLSNHPVVMKKTEAARKLLKAHPVPEHLLKR